ncbi:hypothetical protein [Segnochrobactrum spirostomi]|uniref:Glycoside hydrolase family 5 protein n=1 Tax=Segnochrobactrum spirostomi TaxID=2608987 RepID=A0A6A7Y289_9HYPH|nr:hypothetical protein [Segnochrobactrum spirostomi]MQT11882.1 hypothetical protein [Segnochrobactrum spirostomi]
MTSSYLKGIAYSPTWTTWNGPYSNTGPDAQFSDSDYANDSFQALWNSGQDDAGNSYRDDVGTIGSCGFNLIRLYDWGPTRGWDAATGVGNAHINFLDYAYANGLQVIVPISNYFLSSAEYAWGNAYPDSKYSFDSAPSAITSALTQFIGSVVKNGDIHPAVHSFSVGNEIDINDLSGQGGPAVDPASRLARVIWWIVNLQIQINASSYRAVLLTSPISNGDQGNPESGSAPLSYWFQAFWNGVNSDTLLPFGTVGGSGPTFEASWFGISTIGGANDSWYYNSVNIYQYGSGLATTIGQYDDWSATSVNSTNWPGQQFSVPLLLTETGLARGGVDDQSQETQYNTITGEIAETIASYLSADENSYLIGYCIYEFNDEVTVQANWGLYMVEPESYPSGNVLYQEATGTTQVSYAAWPSVDYPVDQLFPVSSQATGLTLMAALKAIFTSS